MNCLHLSCIFALWNNTSAIRANHGGVVNCLHLSCIFALWNNSGLLFALSTTVVNCLHLSCIFALWNNHIRLLSWVRLLWIACIYLVSLLFETTYQLRLMADTSCELLAFILYLCSLKQRNEFHYVGEFVVNCLHLSCIFALWNNQTSVAQTSVALWIACIYLVSLLFETTFYYSFHFWWSLWIACIYLVSLLFETTMSLLVIRFIRLWIACIYLVSLLFETTLNKGKTITDKLWIACIYLVSLLFETTNNKNTRQQQKLWIACIYLVSLLFETTRYV